MTAELCAKPGFARRSAAYAEQVAACANARPAADLNRLMVDKALALGTGELLTAQERSLMMALLAHLDIGRTAGGETCVWPGAARLCRLLAIGDSTLRRLKASLEEKGFLLRRYDRRNRPLKDGSIDLSPFLLRVPELCEAVGHTEKSVADERHYQTEERYDRPEESARALTGERVIEGNSQREISEPPTAFDRQRPDEVPDAVSPAILGRAIRLMGDCDGPRLVRWAARRHGAGVADALDYLERTPTIRNPKGWFGWYATTTQPIDLPPPPKAPVPLAETEADGQRAALVLNALYDAFGPERVCGYVSSVAEQGESLLVALRSRTAERQFFAREQRAFRDVARRFGFEDVSVKALSGVTEKKLPATHPS